MRVKNVQIFWKFWKILRISEIFQIFEKFSDFRNFVGLSQSGHVSSLHWSNVSMVASLLDCSLYGKSKCESVSQWVSQWVTRSPIELFWTAKKETTLREILGFQIWLQSQILLIQSSTQIHLSTQIQVLFIHSSSVGLGFLSLSMKEKEKIVFIGLNLQTP